MSSLHLKSASVMLKSNPGKSYVKTSTIVKKLEVVLSTTILFGIFKVLGLIDRYADIFAQSSDARSNRPNKADLRFFSTFSHLSSSNNLSKGGFTSKISRAMLFRQVNICASRMSMLFKVKVPAIFEKSPGRSLAHILTVLVFLSESLVMFQTNSLFSRLLYNLISFNNSFVDVKSKYRGDMTLKSDSRLSLLCGKCVERITSSLFLSTISTASRVASSPFSKMLRTLRNRSLKRVEIQSFHALGPVAMESAIVRR